MRVVKLSSHDSNSVLHAFKFTNLSHAIYAALYQQKMQGFDIKAPTIHFKSKKEEYDVLFKEEPDGKVSHYTLELLANRKIQLIYDVQHFVRSKRQIYRKGKSWYVLAATIGGWDGTNPRKRPIEDLASPQRPMSYAPRRAVAPVINSAKKRVPTNWLLPVSPYDFFPTNREFQLYKEYKREGFQRMAFQNAMDLVVSTRVQTTRTQSSNHAINTTPKPKKSRIDSRQMWTGQQTGVLATGGYYHNRGLESRVCSSSANKVNLSSDCSMDNIFHSVLAYSDSCHDFSTYIRKPSIFQVYKANPYYKFDLDKLKVDAQTIVASQLSRGDGLSESSKTTIFLSRLNNVMNNFEDEDNYSAYTPDLLKVVNPDYKNENEIGTKGPSTWEAPFLSKFYYSLFPIMDRENVYKLNVKDPNWGSKLHQMLISEKFTNFFFDMGIARKAEIEQNYRGRDLLRYVETGKLTDSGDNKVITQLDTIAKWWDPSTGGNNLTLKSRDLANFSVILRKEVIRQCGNVRFIEIQELSSDPENTIRLNVEGLVYPDKNKLYLHLETKGGIHLYIAVFKDVFTINNCTWLYDYIENWKIIKNKKLQTIVRDNFQDLKLFVLSLKRSGDHGQSMYLKWYNTQHINQRSFLITGDSLCAVKALYEKVPVLFFKYNLKTASSKPVLDLFFHTPSFIDKQRENYIKTHLIQTLSDDSKALIELEGEKRFYIQYVNNDFKISISISNTGDAIQMATDMRALKLSKLYYEFKNYDKLSDQLVSKALKFFRTTPLPIKIRQELFIEMKVSDELIAKLVDDMRVDTNTSGRHSPRIKIQEAQKRILETNRNTRERFEALTRTISDRFEDVLRNTEILLIYMTLFLGFKKALDGSLFEKQKLDIMHMMSGFFKNTVNDYSTLHNAIEQHYNVLHHSIMHDIFKNTELLHDKNFKLFEMLYELKDTMAKIENVANRTSSQSPPVAQRSPVAQSPPVAQRSLLGSIKSFLMRQFLKT